LRDYLKKIFLNQKYVLYFAILVLVGDVIDISLTSNIRITQPENFYIFEQNTLVKDYIGTDLWFLPIFISLSFSLLIIYLSNKFSDVVARIGLLYFALFTYVYSISWIIGIKIYLYYHFIYLIIFTICIILEFKSKGWSKHPSSG
jgi:hypothetical protein